MSAKRNQDFLFDSLQSFSLLELLKIINKSHRSLAQEKIIERNFPFKMMIFDNLEQTPHDTHRDQVLGRGKTLPFRLTF